MNIHETLQLQGDYAAMEQTLDASLAKSRNLDHSFEFLRCVIAEVSLVMGSFF